MRGWGEGKRFLGFEQLGGREDVEEGKDGGERATGDAATDAVDGAGYVGGGGGRRESGKGAEGLVGEEVRGAGLEAALRDDCGREWLEGAFRDRIWD